MGFPSPLPPPQTHCAQKPRVLPGLPLQSLVKVRAGSVGFLPASPSLLCLQSVWSTDRVQFVVTEQRLSPWVGFPQLTSTNISVL